MKKTALLAIILTAGCAPIPYKHSCRVPNFNENPRLTIMEKFPTSAFFSVRCRTEIPKYFSIAGESTTLRVRVEGEWLRLHGLDREGTELTLQGTHLYRGSDARVDEQPNNILEVAVLPASGGAPEHFALQFEIQECTCVSYDAL